MMVNMLNDLEKEFIIEWKKKRDAYVKDNTVENIKINLETTGNKVIFSKVKDVLPPEGRVKLQLDSWIQGRLNKIINQVEYEVGFPMTYLSDESLIGTTCYSKTCKSKELQEILEINEIITKSMELLNKDTLVDEDFNGMRGYGQIVHCVDDHGRRYFRLINIELYKEEYKRYPELPEKNVLEKKYNELTESDEEKIIKALNLDINTPMGDSKKLIVNSFCNNYIKEEYFMYRGYSFCSIDADVTYDTSKVDQIEDVIELLDIKPKCVEVPPGMYIMKFCPKERFHFKSWIEYLKLLISFVEYLETIHIDGVDISFREFWHDSPDFIEIDIKADTLEDIEFNKERFDFNGKTIF